MSDCYSTHKLTDYLRGEYATWLIYDDGCVRVDSEASQCMWWFDAADSIAAMQAEIGEDWDLVTDPAIPVDIVGVVGASRP